MEQQKIEQLLAKRLNLINDNYIKLLNTDEGQNFQNTASPLDVVCVCLNQIIQGISNGSSLDIYSEESMNIYESLSGTLVNILQEEIVKPLGVHPIDACLIAANILINSAAGSILNIQEQENN